MSLSANSGWHLLLQLESRCNLIQTITNKTKQEMFPVFIYLAVTTTQNKRLRLALLEFNVLFNIFFLMYFLRGDG